MLRGTGATLTLVGAGDQLLAAWARAAREAGFARTAVAPGPAGLTIEALQLLVAAGVGALRVRLYAADAAAHDYHAALEGSFRATTAMLRAARTMRLPVTVTTPLTRSNARVLAALPGLLVDVAAVGWCVRVVGEGAATGDVAGAVSPRLGVALPYALQAIAAAERAGVAAAVEGAPACLLGPLRDRMVAAPVRAFAAVCEGCELRGGCVGVDADYLRRFGASELVPRRPAAVDGSASLRLAVAGSEGRGAPGEIVGSASRDAPGEVAGAGDRARSQPTARMDGHRSGGATGRARILQDMFSGPCLKVSEGACWPI